MGWQCGPVVGHLSRMAFAINPLRIWLNELNLEELARRELLWLLLGIDGAMAAMVLEGISVGLTLASATVVWLHSF